MPLFKYYEEVPEDSEQLPHMWGYLMANTACGFIDRWREDSMCRVIFRWFNNHIGDLKDLKLPLAYRSMFFTQPPVTALLIEPGNFTVYDRSGVTIGMIVVRELDTVALPSGQSYC